MTMSGKMLAEQFVPMLATSLCYVTQNNGLVVSRRPLTALACLVRFRRLTDGVERLQHTNLPDGGWLVG